MVNKRKSLVNFIFDFQKVIRQYVKRFLVVDDFDVLWEKFNGGLVIPSVIAKECEVQTLFRTFTLCDAEKSVDMAAIEKVYTNVHN